MVFQRMTYLLVLIALLLTPLSALHAAGNLQTTSFKEVDTLFSNQGQGWMGKRFHGSVEYYRFNWVDIEPEKGAYNWKPIDDRLARLQKTGGSLSLRVMTASAHSSGYYSSPKWLFDLGCKGYEYNVGGGDPTSGGTAITRIEPEYADPRDWLPCEREITFTMQIPAVPSGSYTLAVAITDSAHQRPSLKLAMDAPEKDGWYQVGSVTVEAISK